MQSIAHVSAPEVAAEYYRDGRESGGHILVASDLLTVLPAALTTGVSSSAVSGDMSGGHCFCMDLAYECIRVLFLVTCQEFIAFEST